MPILGIIASSFRSAAGPTGAYDSLATVTVPSGGVANVTFAGIPTGYKHLELRGIIRPATNNAEIRMTLNSDTATNYSRHRLVGNGASIDATGVATLAYIPLFDANGLQTGTANVFGGFVVDILDYTSTTKAKTVRALAGNDNNGSGQVGLQSGAWYKNTASVYEAVSTINIAMSAGNIDQYSQFALYGVK